jgi:outer membrane receptor for ferrienterochelin and colicins
VKRLLAFCFTAASLCANDTELAKLLDETTEIATKTRINADYVPGTVNVIRGEELKALGILNLNQPNALDMIVGMDSSVNALRGSGAVYGGQGIKIKWLINGRALSSQIWSGSTWGRGIIAFPVLVDQVDRIEIIRGPDSAIYGDNAIFGVINIITKSKNNDVSASGSYQGDGKYGQNASLNINVEKNGFEINSNIGVYKTDGYPFNIPSSGNYYNSVDAAHTPGYGPGDLQNNSFGYSIFTDIAYNQSNKIWLNRLHTKSAQGAFGTWYPTDPLPKNNGELDKNEIFEQFGFEKLFSVAGVASSVKIGLDTSESSIKNFLRYSSDFGLSSVDILRTYKYKEYKKYISGDFEKKVDTHHLLGGVLAQETKNIKDEKTHNVLIGPSSLLYPVNTGRQQKAVFFQDSWDVTDKATVTYGARYDKFDGDIKIGGWSPRLALVYRLDEHNILKTQYARAFRPPSFGEMVDATGQIKSETVDTVEFGHIYKNNNISLKNTIFESRIYNMITFDDWTYTTINLPNTGQIRGLEMEGKYSAESYEVGFNQAFYKTYRDERINRTPPPGNNDPYLYKAGSFPLAPFYIANLFVKLNQNEAYPTTIWYHYTGFKKRKSSFTVPNSDNAKGGSNGSVPPQYYVNITQQFKNIAKDLDLSMGIQNLFGKTLKTLYMPLNQPNNQDIPYMGQSFWVNLSYKF